MEGNTIGNTMRRKNNSNIARNHSKIIYIYIYIYIYIRQGAAQSELCIEKQKLEVETRHVVHEMFSYLCVNGLHVLGALVYVGFNIGIGICICWFSPGQ